MKSLFGITLLACLWPFTGYAGAQAIPDKFPPVSALPSCAGFPDLLVMSDGSRVATKEDWINKRRPELIEQFQHYMYGTFPPKPEKVSGKVEREDRNAFGGKATLKEVTVTFGPQELGPIHLMLVIPNQRKLPA